MSGGPSTRPDKLERARRLMAFDLTHAARLCQQPLQSIGTTVDGFSDPSGDSLRDARVVGFDEAGRGALAGPVVVACVSFPLSRFETQESEFAMFFSSLNDSKRVSARVRERLDVRIRSHARVGVGCASAGEIDRIGIANACRRATWRAYEHLEAGADLALFDRGLTMQGTVPSQGTVPMGLEFTRGDACSFHIAAASIVAKVWRDALMCQLSTREPIYAFSQHKGYGTQAHIDAIRRHGPSVFHRRTFLTRIHRTTKPSC